MTPNNPNALAAESYFHMRRSPFERDIPASALYMSPKTMELLSRLEYAAQKRKFVVVTGDVGVGKTSAIRMFTDRLDPTRFQCVYIADSALKPRVFYWEVLAQIAEDEKPSFYRNEGKRKLLAHMHRMVNNSMVTPILIIDEAHLLSHDMLEETRFLLNNEMDSNNPMALFVIGQSELRAKLSKGVYEPITQRVDFRFKLEPLDRAQTYEYITSHMRYAGSDASVFTDSAVDAVYNYSCGLPRKINKACSLALLYAAQHGKRAVDGADIVFIIEQELTW
jgi:type II secretory pathway predicted ATPase ExeA